MKINDTGKENVMSDLIPRFEKLYSAQHYVLRTLILRWFEPTYLLKHFFWPRAPMKKLLRLRTP